MHAPEQKAGVFEAMADFAPHTLLVEDDRAYARIIQHALRKTSPGCPVHHVTDGDEALDYVHGRGRFADRSRYPLPRLILLDLRMPRVDGFEVLQELKRDPRTRHITIVVMSTSDLASDKQLCGEYGADMFVTKPVQITELFEKLEAIYETLAA